VDTDPILSKLRKLLSKTVANGATEAEAQTALAMAQRLMDEHRLDAADVAGGDPSGPSGVVTADVHEAARNESHYLYASSVTGEAFGVVVLQVRQHLGGKPVGYVYRVFGSPADVEAASWGLDFLATTFRSLWLRYRAARMAPDCDRDSYYVGLCHGFRHRLAEGRRRLELDRPGSGTELALLSARVNEAVAAAFPSVKIDVKRAREGHAYGAGFHDGREINLARPIGADGKPALT
jgi:hypothetical protein